MKECLNCKKAYNAKRASSKFCSVNCRVLHHQKHGKAKIKSADLQEMFNAVLTAVNGINARNGQPPALVGVFAPEKPEEAVMSYNEAKGGIEASTSSVQLEDTWRLVLKQEWKGWQMNELKRLKDIQQTKIDF